MFVRSKVRAQNMIPPLVLESLRTKDPRFPSKPHSNEQISPMHQAINPYQLPGLIDFKQMESNDFNLEKHYL